MSRPKISVFIAHTVDGYIADDAGGIDWLLAAGAEGEDYGFDAFLADVDGVAMGRGTWDVVERFPALPWGQRPVFVFTGREATPHEGVTFWACTPEEAVDAWQARGLRHMYIDGGALISQFLAAGLVDALTLTTVPLLLGSGRPLFHRIASSTPLRLVGSAVFPSGMVTLRYARR